MCGIVAILVEGSLDKDQLERLATCLKRRGPDYISPVITHRVNSRNFSFQVSVLHLRGDRMQKQPVIDQDGNILLFNGEIYAFGGQHIESPTTSDTTFLFQHLNKCSSPLEIAHALAAIDGPFALIYWSQKLESLFYSRDFFGRKSLCHLIDEGQTTIISTLAAVCPTNRDGAKWVEIEAGTTIAMGIRGDVVKYKFDMNSVFPSNPGEISGDLTSADTIVIDVSPISPLNYDLEMPDKFTDSERKSAVNQLETILVEAVAKRVRHNLKDCLMCRSKLVREDKLVCNHSKVMVALSGGIDSTLIALILDKVIDPAETIDLSNVAFKQDAPDRYAARNAFRELCYLCPRRRWRLILCDISKSELQQERTNTIKQLIWPCDKVIDDSLGCACWFASRASGRTVDRGSIGQDSDEFFAFNPSTDARDYSSPAPLCFAGMGIDEQLAGYSSFRKANREEGLHGIAQGISRSMRQIWSRNLGRDDRVFSDHCRELKLPYLDFDLVSYLNQLPVGLKINLSGGTKRILRDLAFKLGLREAAERPKQALQFGSKIAKLEERQEFGDAICTRLLP